MARSPDHAGRLWVAQSMNTLPAPPRCACRLLLAVPDPPDACSRLVLDGSNSWAVGIANSGKQPAPRQPNKPTVVMGDSNEACAVVLLGLVIARQCGLVRAGAC